MPYTVAGCSLPFSSHYPFFALQHQRPQDSPPSTTPLPSTSMKISTWTSPAFVCATLAYIHTNAVETEALRQPMLRSADFSSVDDVPPLASLSHLDEPARADDLDSDVFHAVGDARSLGVLWVPSDFRTGKISLLPTFPPTAVQPSDTPVMSPSVVPGARNLGVSWMPSDLRTGNVSLLPVFPPRPTPQLTALPSVQLIVQGLGVSWMPSDLRTENVSLLPTFPPSSVATPTPTASRFNHNQ